MPKNFLNTCWNANTCQFQYSYTLDPLRYWYIPKRNGTSNRLWNRSWRTKLSNILPTQPKCKRCKQRLNWTKIKIIFYILSKINFKLIKTLKFINVNSEIKMKKNIGKSLNRSTTKENTCIATKNSNKKTKVKII